MQEYFFIVEDVFSEQLHLTVWDSDFGLTDDFLGQLSLPLSEVYDTEHRSVDTWYTLEPRKAKEVVSGEFRSSWRGSCTR
jgi:Ca2+-dependent lipid-binding protein